MLKARRKVFETLQVSEISDLGHRTCGSGVVAAHRKFLGEELCLDFKWTEPRKIRPSLLFSSWAWWKASNVMQLPATAGTRKKKDGSSRRGFISLITIQERLRTTFTHRMYSRALIGGFGRTSYVCLAFQENPGPELTLQLDFGRLQSRTCGSGARVRRAGRY